MSGRSKVTLSVRWSAASTPRSVIGSLPWLIASPFFLANWVELVASAASAEEERFDYLSANGNRQLFGQVYEVDRDDGR